MFSCKRLLPRAFNMGFNMGCMGSSCTALPRPAPCQPSCALPCFCPAAGPRGRTPPGCRAHIDMVYRHTHQGECSYRRADTVRTGRPTYEHLLTSNFRLIVDSTSVEWLFSMTPVPGWRRAARPASRRSTACAGMRMLSATRTRRSGESRN